MKCVSLTRKWIVGHFPTRDRIQRTLAYRLLGRSIFSKDLWRISERPVVDGLALGLFVAFTPTIPFQMLLTTLGALYFRVNLPVALTACWVTNPFTAVPIYLLAWRLGRHLLFEVPWIERLLSTYVVAGTLPSVLTEGMCLWTGSLILATSAASAAGLLTQLVWRGITLVQDKPALERQDRYDKVVYRND